ncbi:LysR family transcriptional regulator [Hydrocarboniphaga sp.]|jgi:DNA-binding transcriptional LysR family regulator|uniref:LysR family transcriptional regulator n=1 Tax=Hydrocarboniphaga sp. TaxID=2033016 RepID=UPI002ABA4E21|nr:LysR family transcriptional regulator [Hydrocarboniphaga sp.]MDZ4078447.1 LysR family transcriptional regulator [Hydrocarboniphaga sp.]
MDAVQSYTAFVRACESGSFSAVARELGTSQSAVSKQIAALERDVGVQLFARTTRRLTPTPEAQTLYEHARQLLDVIDSLRATTNRQASASGTLRMSMPGSYGRHRICPLLPKFLELNPEVRLEITFTDQAIDLVEEGLELGLRVGQLASSSLMARPIGIAEQVLVASKAYLKRYGHPESPADLSELPCILYGRGERWARWEFESENGRHAVEVTGPVRANDPDVMRDLVLDGIGIGLIPDWVVADDLKADTVEALLGDYYPRPLPVNIVYPQTRFLSQRARSFIDFVIAELRARR